MPWTVGFGIIPVTLFIVSSGAFEFAVYNWWSGGFPWYLADSNRVGSYSPHLDYFLLTCWISIAVLAWSAMRRQPVLVPKLRIRACAAIFAIALIGYPLWKQVVRDARTLPVSADRMVVLTAHAREFSMLSGVYYKMGRYTDAATAARQGIALDPLLPEAWNKLAQSAIGLGRWDEALDAARNAVRLAPGDEMARASLTLALSHQ